MKKKILHIILCLTVLVLSNSVLSQNISKVTYKKRSLIVIGEKDRITKKSASKLLEDIFKKMEKWEYALLFTKHKSRFDEVPNMNIDIESTTSFRLSRLMGETGKSYFTNKIEGKIYSQKELDSKLFLVENEIKENWKLTQETKKIGKYICYKATKKDTYLGRSGKFIEKKIIAWYTPKIPYSFGPLKYNGLPGLILELQNQNVVFYAKEIHLNYEKETSIEKPKGKIISEKDFYKMLLSGHK